MGGFNNPILAEFMNFAQVVEELIGGFNHSNLAKIRNFAQVMWKRAGAS